MFRKTASSDNGELVVKDISEELYNKGITHKKECLALVIDNFMSRDECNKLIELTETRGYEQALVNTGGSTQQLMKNVRSSDRCMIDDHDMAATLYAKAEKYMPKNYQKGW